MTRRRHGRVTRWWVVAAVVATGCGSATSSSFDAVTSAGAPSESVASQIPIAPVSPATRDLAALANTPADRVDPPLRRATFAFTGDTLPHRPVLDSAQRHGGGAYDFGPMFARIASIVSWADFAICHLETPVAPAGTGFSGFPVFGGPVEIAEGLAASPGPQ